MAKASTTWKRVKFGEVVRLAKVTCREPIAEGIERAIGLEHLEPGDLRVRSWANIADGTTFTTRVRPGQVLFGKRRAYQRKVAVADFDAICSGDIYVFESANPEQLLPTLLPFICQTDAFFEHAVGTSAGSLSPRTNWSSLAEYEFALPPLEEQRRCVGVLSAAVEVIDAAGKAEEAASTAAHSMLTELYSEHHGTVPLSDFCLVPIARGIDQAGPDTPSGIPYIRVSDLTKGETLTVSGMLRTTPERAARFSSATVCAGDIVVALRGALGLARLVPPELAGANLTQGTVRVSVKRELSRDYVYYGLQSRAAVKAFRRHAAGWKGESLREITLEAIRVLPFPWVPVDEQHRIGALAREAFDAVRRCASRREAARALFTSLQAAALGS